MGKARNILQIEILGKQVVSLKEAIYLRMNNGDFVIKHLNSFNIVASQLLFVDIKIYEEEKCISLPCSFPNSWDSLVVAIGSNTNFWTLICHFLFLFIILFYHLFVITYFR